MTFKTCNRCGAIARILAGGISHLNRNCVSDLYRCEECHVVTWQDRVHRTERNYFRQVFNKVAPVDARQRERAPFNV
jgi:hypothetical protein